MKTLKFASDLVSMVLDGSKTSTWRMFDDKDLRVGDNLSLVDKEMGNEFAKAKIVRVREKRLGELDENDYAEKGEVYQTEELRLPLWKRYYGEQVTLDTPVKMVDFELVSALP